jgi:hypothetical protein
MICAKSPVAERGRGEIKSISKKSTDRRRHRLDTERHRTRCVQFIKNHKIVSVKLLPLPAHWTLTNEVNGIRIRPDIPVLGIVDVKYIQQPGGTRLSYGKTGDEFYISANIKEPVTK